MAPTEFARRVDVPPNRVGQTIAGKRSASAGTVLRTGHWFGVEAQFWLNLQTQFDLAVAEESIEPELKRLPTAAVPAYSTMFQSFSI